MTLALTPTQKLIADHINARAEHDRLFHLHDWGLVSGEEETEALGPLDAALVALCASRPTTADERKLRTRYLRSVDIPARIDGCADLSNAVINALIDEGP